MSENILDSNPELWDLGYNRQDTKAKIDYAKEHYERKGSCKRCGKCCYYWNGVKSEGGKLQPCKHLINNGDGTFTCAIYDKPERPRICVECPIKPTLNQEYYEGNVLLPDNETTANPNGCGFYWVKKVIKND